MYENRSPVEIIASVLVEDHYADLVARIDRYAGRMRNRLGYSDAWCLELRESAVSWLWETTIKKVRQHYQSDQPVPGLPLVLASIARACCWRARQSVSAARKRNHADDSVDVTSGTIDLPCEDNGTDSGGSSGDGGQSIGWTVAELLNRIPAADIDSRIVLTMVAAGLSQRRISEICGKSQAAISRRIAACREYLPSWEICVESEESLVEAEQEHGALTVRQLVRERRSAWQAEQAAEAARRDGAAIPWNPPTMPVTSELILALQTLYADCDDASEPVVDCHAATDRRRARQRRLVLSDDARRPVGARRIEGRADDVEPFPVVARQADRLPVAGAAQQYHDEQRFHAADIRMAIRSAESAIFGKFESIGD